MEKTSSFLKRISSAFLPALALVYGLGGLGGTLCHATQSTLNLGVSLYPQTGSNLLGLSGYLLNFQVEKDGKWFRPNFGGQIEYSSSGGTLVSGQMVGGVQAVPAESKFIKPFIGMQALLGWTNFAVGTTSSIGIIYGGVLSAGTEIRFSKKGTATALRLSTQYRYTQGTIGGGVSGSDMSAVQVLIGIIF